MPSISIPKADPEISHRFERLVPTASDVEVRKMFGQPAAFGRGYLFFGVFGSRLFVRLGPVQSAEARKAIGAAPFEPMPGRAMSGYVVLPDSVVRRDADARTWIERSLTFVRTLPVKPTSRRAPKARGR